MNKKANTVLFIIGATIFNVLIIFVVYFGCILIFFRLFYNNDSMADYVGILNIVFFIGSIIGSFVIYRIALKIISKKIDMDKYFEPIISRKK